MNQILYTEAPKKSKGPASIKSIVTFFSIAVIILGLIFLGKALYSLYTNNELATVPEEDTKATIEFEREVNNTILTISSNIGLSKVKYYWNDEDETIVQGNSEKMVILDNITIPSGINTLHVIAIDINGNQSEDSYEYSYDRYLYRIISY